MKKVFVSGCYDILHAGHIQFFRDARALGDHLTVCFASAEVLKLAKNRTPAIPDNHKKVILESLRFVDRVVSSSDLDPVLDFVGHLEKEKPDILASTEDDKNITVKRILCKKLGIDYVILSKTALLEPISTTTIRESIKKSK
jgi:cytidyltransferase-like protein